ncbi:MAG: hypothetical protein WAW61_22360 [Methylococcaceae bacterium]|jgi:hypothetical protein
MANDTELKAKVEESVHDDFVSLCRDYGFDHKSEFLRFLILRELYGAKAQQQINRMPGALKGLS